MPRIQRVSSPHVAEPSPERWSNALRVGDALYLAGFTSRGNDGQTIEGRGEYEQARIVFAKIRHLVEAAGGVMADVVKLNIYLVDIRNNSEVWRARREFFTGNFPVSTLVEVKGLATPEILVEIEAVAHVGASRG